MQPSNLQHISFGQTPIFILKSLSKKFLDHSFILFKQFKIDTNINGCMKKNPNSVMLRIINLLDFRKYLIRILATCEHFIKQWIGRAVSFHIRAVRHASLSILPFCIET